MERYRLEESRSKYIRQVMRRRQHIYLSLIFIHLLINNYGDIACSIFAALSTVKNG